MPAECPTTATGNLTEAKKDFDHAVDLMLASGIDLKSDPQLSEEFEHIVDAVNTLEMQALKQGNGFAPKIEPSPSISPTMLHSRSIPI